MCADAVNCSVAKRRCVIETGGGRRFAGGTCRQHVVNLHAVDEPVRMASARRQFDLELDVDRIAKCRYLRDRQILRRHFDICSWHAGR
jgi:hypothetical protein